jgi:osmotically-inducible protein OsmY
MNERDPYNRTRQQGGYNAPRQSEQWQAEPPRQAGAPQQQREQRPSYDDYVREREHAVSSTGEQAYHQPLETSPGDYPARHSPHSYDASYGNAYSSFTSEDYGGRDLYRGMGAGGFYGAGYGMAPSFGTDYMDRHRHERDYDDWRSYGHRRGFLDRARDEVASWFGDEDASRRRDMDHTGRGPSDYVRSDERIREDVNDRLTLDPRIDATNVSVSVSSCEVTLNGTVQDRWAKRRAEDAADRVAGVKHVQNNLRVADAGALSAGKSTGKKTG